MLNVKYLDKLNFHGGLEFGFQFVQDNLCPHPFPLWKLSLGPGAWRQLVKGWVSGFFHKNTLIRSKSFRVGCSATPNNCEGLVILGANFISFIFGVRLKSCRTFPWCLSVRRSYLYHVITSSPSQKILSMWRHIRRVFPVWNTAHHTQSKYQI